MPDLTPIVEDGATYLVTTDAWFWASDGTTYRAVWGPCRLKRAEEALGFRPSRSTNWFLQVGDGDGAVIIAGCQVHYLQRLSRPPTVRTEKDDQGNDFEAILILDRPEVASEDG